MVRATLAGDPTAGPADLVRALAGIEAGSAEAAVATWGETRVAVVVVGGATAGLTDDGSGWRWVAGRVGETRVWPSLPAVYAVVGSDARPGEDPARARADSIHLVGLAGDGSAALVGIPRDWWVQIPGAGVGKINGSLSRGGPELMMATFEQSTGVDLAGYVLTGFVGFQEMVGNVLGGFELDIPFAFRDPAAGADFSAGPRYMNGPDALAFARARKSMEQGDFTRQLNGELVLMGALGAVKLLGPLQIPRLLEGSEQWLLTDLAPEQLLELALAAADTRLTEIDNVVAPGTTTTRGGASVVTLSGEADQLFADLADARLGD